MDGTNAGSLSKSSKTPPGSIALRSEQAVARPSTAIDELLSKPSHRDVLLVLLAMLKGYQRHTFSGDVRSLVYIQAAHECQQLGISETDFTEVAQRLLVLGKAGREHDPMSGMF